MPKNKKTRVKMATPAGKFHFPALHRPDDKFADTRKPDGEYKCGLILDPTTDDAKAFIARLEKVRDDYRAERLAAEEDPKKRKALEKYTVKPVYTEQIDDDGNETGNVIFNARQAATIVAANGTVHKFSVLVVDAKRNKVTKPVWGGSVGKLSVEASGYDMPTDKSFGVSLGLVGAQILELKSGGGEADAADLFDEEDGFVDEGDENTDSFDGEADGDADASDF